MQFGTIFFWTHLLGVLVSWIVLYRRSGLSAVKAEAGIDWREFLIPNIGYFLLMWAKCIVWEVNLVIWLATGMPESRWKAAIDIDGREVRAITRVQAG